MRPYEPDMSLISAPPKGVDFSGRTIGSPMFCTNIGPAKWVAKENYELAYPVVSTRQLGSILSK